LAGFASVASATSSARAAASPDEPLITLRRATIVVSDMEKSVAFYRDVLGLKEVDEASGDTAVVQHLFPFGLTEGRFHLKMMGGAEGSGIVGLLEFSNPGLPAGTGAGTRVKAGDVVLVLRSDEIEALAARLDAHDAKTYHPLKELRSGSGSLLLTCADPDGTYIEVSGPAKP
jgi:catechol 2,3-dioxygenase-like lactoylglutathione lyase family enzyme